MGRGRPCSVHVREEEGPSQSIEVLALYRLRPFSWKFWAAFSRACRGQGDGTWENPYGPQGPAAHNRVEGSRAWAAGDHTENHLGQQILFG